MIWLSCVGQYGMPPVMSAVGRSPAAPAAHLFSAYAASATAVDTAASTRHSPSPITSDLREALAQPSRLVQQEQLLAAKQQQQQQRMVPLLRTAVPPVTVADLTCRSPPVGLGQHRMPFTVLEPRSMSSSRAEPKTTIAEPVLQRLPLPPTQPPVSSDLGGSFAAGRLEPPRTAAAMLSNSFIGVPDFVMAQLQQQRQQQQQQHVAAEVVHRFHPGAARPGGVDAVRVAAASTYSPALPGVIGLTPAPPPAPPQPNTQQSNCVGGRDSPLVSSTSTLGDLQIETFNMNTTKVLEVLRPYNII